LAGLAGFWYWQKNSYSKETLKLEILGPSEAPIAQEFEYTVKYKNNGNIRLEDPRLIFEFPEHAILNEGESRRKEMGSDELGDIYPGEEKTFKFKCRLLGTENEVKTAKATLTYRPKNLKAEYVSETTFSTTIKAVSLTFDFDLPSKVEKEREFKFYLNYFSSLDYPLTNLGIKIEYPSGFEFSGSTPRAIGKTEWKIPLLNKAEGGRIEIKGKLLGDVEDQRIFKASIGVWSSEEEFVLLKEIIKGVEIAKPGLFIFQQINGKDEYTANAGDLLHYEIFFRNIGEDPFADMFIIVKLDGAAYDFSSIKSDVGQFQSGDNSIVWDWRTIPRLKYLGKGEEGKVEFWINLKQQWDSSGQPGRNLILRDKIQISQAEEEFETKINSRLVISQKGLFQDEVFGNTGPIPPRVGQSTTYTIYWQVRNYYNDLKNVKVKATLPQNVTLTGKIFPESEASKFSFDSISREIVWTVADGQGLPAGTGVNSTPPSIYFQVSLIPSISQRGLLAQIISQARIRGEDQFTDTIVESVAPAVDSSIPEDSAFSGQQGIVE